MVLWKTFRNIFGKIRVNNLRGFTSFVIFFTIFIHGGRKRVNDAVKVVHGTIVAIVYHGGSISLSGGPKC